MKKAERWRVQVIREISRKVSQIQNREYLTFHQTFFSISENGCMFSAGLGEFRIRDLNDEINKLLREKRHWEERIVELGGTDYIVRDRQGGEGEDEGEE